MSSDVARIESSMDEQMEFARMVTSQPERGAQSLLPDIYRNNPANVLICTGLGASMGLSKAESLYRIAVIKGKPAAGAELIASNVRKAGHRLRVRGDDTTCTASIVRADDPEFEFEVTRDIAWAKGMGLASNDNYKKQPGTMLQWRAITAVARLACPEALYGVAYTADELTDDGEAQPKAPAKRGGMAGLRDAVAAPVIEYVVEPTPQTDDAAESTQDKGQDATAPTAASPDLMTRAQSKMLHALLNKHGMTERDDYLKFLSREVGRTLTTSNELTRAEASRLIDAETGSTTVPEPTF